MMQYTTLRVGGPADALIIPRNKEELAELIGNLTERNISWQVIGKGSNILIADQGVEGVVIVFGKGFGAICEQESDDQKTHDQSVIRNIHVEAGCSLAKLTQWCIERELSGLEFAAGIPGSIGGAIMMNAGAWGKEIGDVISSIEFINNRGEIKTKSLSPKDFCYRGMRNQLQGIVTSGVFGLASSRRAEIEKQCSQYNRLRKKKQPQGLASAGSFFKNPPGEAAGRLIEQAGLKGVQIGGAAVSSVHANFFVNTGEAMADDFFQLMKMVQEKVKSTIGIELEPEVEYVGRWQHLNRQSRN